jgi:hypothetical protein
VAEAEKHQAKATAKFEERRKALRRLERSLASLLAARALNAFEEDAIRDRLDALRVSLEDMGDVRPGTGSIFVRAFLGQVNVKAASGRDRAKLRDEYNKFKDRTNLGFIVLPVIWILTYLYLRHKWRYTAWIHILTHVWLLYYYVSLSLRWVAAMGAGKRVTPCALVARGRGMGATHQCGTPCAALQNPVLGSAAC